MRRMQIIYTKHITKIVHAIYKRKIIRALSHITRKAIQQFIKEENKLNLLFIIHFNNNRKSVLVCVCWHLPPHSNINYCMAC